MPEGAHGKHVATLQQKWCEGATSPPRTPRKHYTGSETNLLFHLLG